MCDEPCVQAGGEAQPATVPSTEFAYGTAQTQAGPPMQSYPTFGTFDVPPPLTQPPSSGGNTLEQTGSYCSPTHGSHDQTYPPAYPPAYPSVYPPIYGGNEQMYPLSPTAPPFDPRNQAYPPSIYPSFHEPNEEANFLPGSLLHSDPNGIKKTRIDFELA